MNKESRWDLSLNRLQSRSRTILLSLVILVICIQNIHFNDDRHAAQGIALGLVYLVFLWMPKPSRTANGVHIAAVGLLWLLTALLCSGNMDDSLTYALTFFLLGYIALRLSGVLSYLLAAGVIGGNAVVLFVASSHSYPEKWTYVLVLTASYVFMWGIRVRRESRESSRKHFEALTVVHAQLEKAHSDLLHAHQELEEATVRSLQYAVLEERTRIARDIHDSIGHGLTSVIVQLQALPYMIKSNSTDINQTLSSVLEVARECLTEVRAVVHQMAVEDSDLGLVALKRLTKQVEAHSGLTISLQTEQLQTTWEPDIGELMYRVLQEALTNVVRHANASHVEVWLQEHARELTMRVKDDGTYTAEAAFSPGFGLSGMRARCERAGGSLLVQGCEPHGWMIAATVPLERSGEGGEEHDNPSDPRGDRR